MVWKKRIRPKPVFLPVDLRRSAIPALVLLFLGFLLTLFKIQARLYTVEHSSLHNLKQQQQQQQTENPYRILYVHVGKTGGEWVKAQVQVSCKTRKNPSIRKACTQEFADPRYPTPTRLSQYTIGYLHTTLMYPRNAISLATHYMYTLRNPTARICSWYLYNHPESCNLEEDDRSPSCKLHQSPSKYPWSATFFSCFPTLETFAQTFLEADNDMNRNETCKTIAWQAILGKEGDVGQEKQMNHLFWNYKVCMGVCMY